MQPLNVLLQQPVVVLIGLAVSVLILAGFVLWLTHTASTKAIDQFEEEAKSEEKKNPDKNRPYHKRLFAIQVRYLERNLAQNKHVYTLTTMMFVSGFIMIAYAGWLSIEVIRASEVAANIETASSWTQPLSIITAGVLTEFLAATILIMFRSVFNQTELYFGSLERLNTVGMALQILDDLNDDKGVEQQIKSTTKADLAKKLLEFHTVRKESSK